MRVRENPPSFDAFQIGSEDFTTIRAYLCANGLHGYMSVWQVEDGPEQRKLTICSGSGAKVTYFDEKVNLGDWVVFGRNAHYPEVYSDIEFNRRFSPAHW